jgi:nucleoid-associated protein YgaU
MRLLALEAVAAAAVVGLARTFAVTSVADWSWLAHADTARLAGALGWWIAAALTAWTVATTVLGIASREFPALRSWRGIDRVTAAFVRRALDHALVVSLAAGVVAGAALPAAAATTTTSAAAHRHAAVRVTPDGEVVIDSASSTSTTVPRSASPSTTTATTTPPSTQRRSTVPSHRAAPPRSPHPVARPPAPTVSVPTPPAPAMHVVVAGDNLWRIAADHLSALGNARPDDHTVASYWRLVIAANRATLRSGDPNLIYPGEIVLLPQVTAGLA